MFVALLQVKALEGALRKGQGDTAHWGVEGVTAKGWPPINHQAVYRINRLLRISSRSVQTFYSFMLNLHDGGLHELLMLSRCVKASVLRSLSTLLTVQYRINC